MQLGARESENRQTYNESDFGLAAAALFGTDPFTFPEQSTKANAFTYLVTPSFKVSPDLMVYVRLASGYRAGGNNGEATAFNLPLTFKPDRTQSYELGLKGSLLDRLLSFDTSLYYIDWKDVQLDQVDPLSGLGFFTNGGRARSEGLELALQSSPLKGLTLALTGAYSNAELREDLPLTAGYGLSGDRLPFSPKFSGSFTADQEAPLTGRLSGFAGTTVAYTGSRFGSFVNPLSDSPADSGHSQRDAVLHNGRFADGCSRCRVAVSLFVDNVGDKRGFLNAQSRVGGSATPTNPYTVTG